MRHQNWGHRNAFNLALIGTLVLLLLKQCPEVDELITPMCSSKKCPHETLGIYLEGECWCVTKPDP